MKAFKNFLENAAILLVVVVVLCGIAIGLVAFFKWANTPSDGAKTCYAYGHETHQDTHFWVQRKQCVIYVKP